LKIQLLLQVSKKWYDFIRHYVWETLTGKRRMELKLRKNWMGRRIPREINIENNADVFDVQADEK
jgi:hypothetical protein